MKILIACEESGRVRDAFLAKGHDAVSCDIVPTSAPGPHIQADVLTVLDQGWDMMIAFPDCRFLTVTANRHFLDNPERWKKRYEAMLFVHALYHADIPKIAIENPVGVISTHIRKPDQYIQPCEYGHPLTKKTGLWLKNLPLLQPTNIVKPEYVICKSSGKRYSPVHFSSSSTFRPDVSRDRARTFEGVAEAMAAQWG